MQFELRPYQEEATSEGVSYLTNPKLKNRNGVIVAPTGSGKSLVIASIATRLPGPCIVFQPSKEILQQNLAKLASYGYRPAVFSASMDRREIGKITLATIGTAVSAAEYFADLPYVLIDECHLVNPKAGMYRDFLDAMQAKRVLGLTATPYRLASNSLGSELRFITRTRPRVFRDVVHVTQIGDLFEQRFLAPLEYEIVEALPRERLKMNTKGSDYSDASVRSLFGEVGFVGRLVEQVQQELAAGAKNVLVFTRFVEESERIARALPGLVAVVTSDTPDRERQRILEDFKAGRLRVVANVGIIAIGFDYPELECVILGRPTVSLAVYYQQVGRVLRPHPNKPKARVVDLVGLVKQFGRVEDIVIRPGGAKGDLWTVCSKERPLTNVLFAERDGLAPEVAVKQQKKRRFWAKGGRKRFWKRKKPTGGPTQGGLL